MFTASTGQCQLVLSRELSANYICKYITGEMVPMEGSKSVVGNYISAMSVQLCLFGPYRMLGHCVYTVHVDVITKLCYWVLSSSCCYHFPHPLPISTLIQNWCTPQKIFQRLHYVKANKQLPSIVLLNKCGPYHVHASFIRLNISKWEFSKY